MNSIFSKSSKIYEAIDTGHVPVEVKIGKSKKVKSYLMVSEAGGKQPFRTQYDIALDGTEYFLTADKGAGDYMFTLLEGPIKTCSGSGTPDSFIKDFKDMRTADSRRITIVTKPENDSTRHSMTFSGIITNIQTRTARGDTDGLVTVTIGIGAIGRWS